jgi:hypothetical protein
MNAFLAKARPQPQAKSTHVCKQWFRSEALKRARVGLECTEPLKRKVYTVGGATHSLIVHICERNSWKA